MFLLTCAILSNQACLSEMFHNFIIHSSFSVFARLFWTIAQVLWFLAYYIACGRMKSYTFCVIKINLGLKILPWSYKYFSIIYLFSFLPCIYSRPDLYHFYFLFSFPHLYAMYLCCVITIIYIYNHNRRQCNSSNTNGECSWL